MQWTLIEVDILPGMNLAQEPNTKLKESYPNRIMDHQLMVLNLIMDMDLMLYLLPYLLRIIIHLLNLDMVPQVMVVHIIRHLLLGMDNQDMDMAQLHHIGDYIDKLIARLIIKLFAL
jgi:hypothetical protein